MKDLPEMRREILRLEPRYGIAAEKSPLARLDRRRTSLEFELWLTERDVVVEEKAPYGKASQTKGRVQVMCSL
jgi:hypothetical protein